MLLTTETITAYEELSFVVEVCDRDPQRAICFEPIAAFNVGSVARRYADKCRNTNPHNLYRVRVREDGGWLVYEGTT